jgi:hypothetical protein
VARTRVARAMTGELIWSYLAFPSQVRYSCRLMRRTSTEKAAEAGGPG